MPVTSIKIRDERGNLVAGGLSGTLYLGSGSISLDADKSQNSITLAALGSNLHDTGETVYNRVLESPYVSTVQSVGPAEDGSFFVLGSGCWDWHVRTDIPWQPLSATGPCTMFPVLHLNDLCATCTSCAETLKLKKLVEFYKLALTAMKDVSISSSSVQEYNQNYLQTRRLPVSEACLSDMKRLALDADLDEVSGKFEMDNLRLLGQYLTVVHMWNYVMSMKKRNDTVDAIPDSDYGFGVTTSFMVPSCDGTVAVSCSVEVALVSGQQSLSVYVHDPSFSFSPGETDGGGPMAATVTHSAATTKSVSLARVSGGGNGKAVGAWTLSVKFLPFFNAVTKDADDTVIDFVDDTDPCVLKKTTVQLPGGGEYVTYNNMELAQSISQLTSPTKQDYLKSQAYFSQPAVTSNTWQVRITWMLSGGISRTSTETYYRTTPGVRELALAGMLSGMTLYNPEA